MQATSCIGRSGVDFRLVTNSTNRTITNLTNSRVVLSRKALFGLRFNSVAMKSSNSLLSTSVKSRLVRAQAAGCFRFSNIFEMLLLQFL